jgi:bifunctional N-acetylglucosamine-1-phosphate-uridyltransferase/glucosamine-1-phosphate-acetyltransferase GlmU-like protein
MLKNYQKIKSGEHDELELPRKEVAELKQVQKTHADIMKANKMDWEKERQQLKEKKRKVEYALYDVVQVNTVNKDKVERITAICNE